MTDFAVSATIKAIDRITAPMKRMESSVARFSRSAGQSIKRVSAGMDRVNAGLFRHGRTAALGAGAAFGGLFLAMGRVTGEADKLAKLSRRIDFDIGALQEWQFVAGQSGVNTLKFNDLLGKFTKRMGEARAGQGPLVSGLKNLDGALLENLLSAESNTEAFELVIDAMRNAGDAADAARISNAAFSTSGLDLANIAKNTAHEVSDLRAEMRANGLITDEQAQGAAAYNDALSSLSRAVMGLINSALLPLAPHMTKIVENMRAFVIANREVASGRILQWFKNFTASIDRVVSGALAFGQVFVILSGLSVALKGVSLAFGVLNAVMALSPIGAVALGLTAITAAALTVAHNMDKVRSIFAVVTRFVKGFIDNISVAFGWVERTTGLARSVGGFLGFDGPGEGAGAIAPEVLGPVARAAQSAETITRQTVDLNINDRTGAAELGPVPAGAAVNFNLARSGSFE